MQHALIIMETFLSILTVATVSLLGAISPGPDFFVVVKNSLSYSRKVGMLTALGVATALLIHISYTLIGIGVLLTESSYLYKFLKYIGAGYLFYLGCKGLSASFQKQSPLEFKYAGVPMTLSSRAALKQGFLTNLLNPKCALFFVSFFSQFIMAETPLSLKLAYAGANWCVTLGWFLFLSYMITGKYMLTRIGKFRVYIDRLMGGILILLSLKLLFT